MAKISDTMKERLCEDLAVDMFHDFLNRIVDTYNLHRYSYEDFLDEWENTVSRRIEYYEKLYEPE